MLLIDYEDGFAVMSGRYGRDARKLSFELLNYMAANGVDFQIGGKTADVVMTINPRSAEACRELRAWWTKHARANDTTVSLAVRAVVASDRLESLRRAVEPLLPTNDNPRLDEQVELLAALRLIEPDGAHRYHLTELGTTCLARLDDARPADVRATSRTHRTALATPRRD